MLGDGGFYFGAYKTLIDVLCYPIRLFDEHGRVGGSVAIVAGVGMLGLGLWLGGTVSLLGLGVAVVGIAYCGFGLSRFVGLQARLRREYTNASVASTMSKADLERAVESRPLPFFVCVRCRLAMEPAECGGLCPKCGSDTDCLPVDAEDDRSIVRASIY